MVYHQTLLYENIEVASCDITHDTNENDRFGYTLGSQKLRPLVTDPTDCFVLLGVSLAAELCKQRIHYVFPRWKSSKIASGTTGSNVLKTFFFRKVMISLFMKIVKTKSIPFIPVIPFKDSDFLQPMVRNEPGRERIIENLDCGPNHDNLSTSRQLQNQ